MSTLSGFARVIYSNIIHAEGQSFIVRLPWILSNKFNFNNILTYNSLLTDDLWDLIDMQSLFLYDYSRFSPLFLGNANIEQRAGNIF